MRYDILKMHQEVFDLLMRFHKVDPNIHFTFRKINRKSRLDQGYWFLGGDNYLTVSFWTGRDWVTRMPNISFTITTEGNTILELNAKDVSRRFDFFEQSMVEDLGATPRGYNHGYYKRYTEFPPEDYLKSLESFLENDKLIIDKAVRNRKAFSEVALEYTDAIDFIYREQFKNELENIKKYQSRLEAKIKNTGYLKYIKIHNYTPISDVSIEEIPDGCRWIFLTGENGAGKTSLLKAIATGLTANIDNGASVTSVTSEFIIKLGFDALNGIKHHIVHHSDPIESRNWLAKGLAFYGPVRLFTKGNIDKTFFTVNESEIFSRATYGLFNSIDLLRDLSSQGLLDRPKYHQMALENLILNLEEILPGMVLINYKMDSDGNAELTYFFEKEEGNVPVKGVNFNELPSGTRNFAAIILDLLIRFREQQPNVYDLAEYSGIVLIDEIDLHLHPKMQKEIVSQLADTFPNIQFIVTTHSPIPLLGAPKNSMFINVHKNESHEIVAEQINIDVTNLLPNTILSSPIFDFNGMSSINHDKSQRLVSEDDYDEYVFYKILERKIRERTLNRRQE